MPDQMGIFDVMYNCRAMRRLKTTPVEKDLLLKLIDAANRAPTGSNAQNARWIIVQSAEQKAELAELNRKAVEAYVSPASARPSALPHQSADKRQRQLKAVLWQAEHLAEVPALIIACLKFDQRVDASVASRAGGNIWPAVQNLLLAARALGLGAAPTTLGLSDHAAFRDAMRLPENVLACCLIPVGYPSGNFGPVARMPVEETVCWDRWQDA